MKDRGHIDRIQLLLDERTETRVWLEKPRTRRTAPQTLTLDVIEDTSANIPPSLNGSLSTLSTASSGYKHRNSDASSRRSVTVTDASSVTAPHPGYVPPPTLDQHLVTLPPPDVRYDLQCEFRYIGCDDRFHPSDSESWITHTLSHFPRNMSPPSRADCIFCDTRFDRFKRQLNPEENWRQRMEHIHDHLRDGMPAESARPDFFVIDHMRANGLISPADHRFATDYTERPPLDGLKPLGWEPVEKKLKRERGLQQPYDLDREERTRRREHSTVKGKGRQPHGPPRLPTA